MTRIQEVVGLFEGYLRHIIYDLSKSREKSAHEGSNTS